MRQSKQLQIGKVGEYLTCADLILKGFIAFPSEQGLPYDVLLDNGSKLLKVQVKTTEKPRIVPQRKEQIPAYIFSIKRHGKNNVKRYLDSEVDLFALVCLDTMQIGYIANDEMPDTLNLRVDSFGGKYYDEKGILNYQLIQGYKDEGYSQNDVIKKTGISQATVNRMWKDEYKPHITNAKYFSAIKRNSEWIRKL